MLGLVSVFVAVILGLLIVYANNFLINRRKKEFGIYMTLGMNLFDQRNNVIVYILFNGVALYDVFLMRRFVRWGTQYLPYVGSRHCKDCFQNGNFDDSVISGFQDI